MMDTCGARFTGYLRPGTLHIDFAAARSCTMPAGHRGFHDMVDLVVDTNNTARGGLVHTYARWLCGPQAAGRHIKVYDIADGMNRTAWVSEITGSRVWLKVDMEKEAV